MSLRPLGDRLLVKPTPAEKETKSGIIIPGTAQEKPQKGTILDVGQGRLNTATGQYEPFAVQPGDEVLYSRYGGTEIESDGEDLLLLRETDVLARVDDDDES